MDSDNPFASAAHNRVSDIALNNAEHLSGESPRSRLRRVHMYADSWIPSCHDRAVLAQPSSGACCKRLSTRESSQLRGLLPAIDGLARMDAPSLGALIRCEIGQLREEKLLLPGTEEGVCRMAL